MVRTQGLAALKGLVLFVIFILSSTVVIAAPYAAMVMDARTGEVLHSRNADTRLHPASLTKMMTLYIAFQAVERGEISLDDRVTISAKAASEPPSKLGLKSGQRIALRYLIRAAAVKSANDAATAIAEAIEGSEAAFARRMNRTAKQMGMTRTTFRNAHGLTETGHMSTARDMTLLGRRVFYDYPQYYNIFSRQSTHAGMRSVSNTNNRLLNAYRGADGIKTGYTRAAGFNLVASAERGQERIIATVFGGRSTASRNARVAELLDMGFKRAPSRVTVRRPAPLGYGNTRTAKAPAVRAVATSIRPNPKPGPVAPPQPLTAELQKSIAATVAQAQKPVVDLDQKAGALVQSLVPRSRPAAVDVSRAVAPANTVQAGEQVVTRLSTSGGRHWGITVGRYTTRHQAERVLLQTALLELGTLDEALRKVVERPGGFDANFVGMSQEQADVACRRLVARNVDCSAFGPG